MKNTKQALKKSAVSSARPKASQIEKAKKILSVGNGEGPTIKLILTTHNITLTDAIASHIQLRVDQLRHLEPRAIDARVTIEHDHKKVDRQFKCSILLSEPGPDLFAEDAENDLYAAIDLVAKKMEQQIRKRHGKFKTRNHGEAAKGKRLRQETAG